MNPSATVVDLGRAPRERWDLSSEHIEQARTLMRAYTDELGGTEVFGDLLSTYAESWLRPDHFDEVRAIADLTGESIEQALLGNLYYDAVKLVLGCTAFAVDTPSGPLHARNLDWWTENDTLSAYTLVTDFHDPHRKRSFSTIGWPGFVGALSGIAPGRFAITLNAVLSAEAPAFAPSVSFLIRTVLEEADTYGDAVARLAAEPIATDCLLLVTGAARGEMAVVERTPSKSAIRHAESGFVAVANGYRLIDADTGEANGALQTTSCGRYERAMTCLRERRPQTTAECFAILSDEAVAMSITVQQMVLQASTGRRDVRLPPRTTI
ncbi:MAG: C45 family peptidase [Bacteroidota bacterium]